MAESRSDYDGEFYDDVASEDGTLSGGYQTRRSARMQQRQQRQQKMNNLTKVMVNAERSRSAQIARSVRSETLASEETEAFLQDQHDLIQESNLDLEEQFAADRANEKQLRKSELAMMQTELSASRSLTRSKSREQAMYNTAALQGSNSMLMKFTNMNITQKEDIDHREQMRDLKHQTTLERFSAQAQQLDDSRRTNDQLELEHRASNIELDNREHINRAEYLKKVKQDKFETEIKFVENVTRLKMVDDARKLNYQQQKTKYKKEEIANEQSEKRKTIDALSQATDSLSALSGTQTLKGSPK